MATLFAWTGALRKRGQLDDNGRLVDFAGKLEEATVETIEAGIMTGDLAAMSTLPEIKKVNTQDFLMAIKERLESKL